MMKAKKEYEAVVPDGCTYLAYYIEDKSTKTVSTSREYTREKINKGSQIFIGKIADHCI